jgi:hypothetical protein
MDVRADRPATFTSKSLVSETPARIMSQEQMRELGRWLSENKKGLAILVSSVPVLLPPLIGLAEYMMGIRPLYKGMRPLRWVGRQLARIQHKLAVGTSFDHWPVFAVTWHELVEMLKESPQDVLVLSGDVHFSYAMEAHVGRSIRKKSGGARLYQLVSTPLQNELSDSNRRLVLGQAWLRGARYGGLRVRMLPMVSRDKKQGGPRDLLLENVVAMVTVEVGDEGYEVRQEYLGLVDGQGKMDVVGETLIQ